jgi:hypothetical protein
MEKGAWLAEDIVVPDFHSFNCSKLVWSSRTTSSLRIVFASHCIMEAFDTERVKVWNSLGCARPKGFNIAI